MHARSQGIGKQALWYNCATAVLRGLSDVRAESGKEILRSLRGGARIVPVNWLLRKTGFLILSTAATGGMGGQAVVCVGGGG